MHTPSRDYAAEYLTARLAYHQHMDWDAADQSHVIADEAYDAGVRIDEVDLDEQARIAANGGNPLTTR